MDHPFMSRCGHLEHDLWTAPAAANVNAAPTEDVLTAETAIAYVKGKFVEWYGSADAEYKVVGFESIDPIAGMRSALVICVHCKNKDGDILPFYVWLNEYSKLYGEF